MIGVQVADEQDRHRPDPQPAQAAVDRGRLRPGVDDHRRTRARSHNQRIALADHVGFVGPLAPGLLEPYELTLPLVERPSESDTLLSARLRPFWDGTGESLSVTEMHLFCA